MPESATLQEIRREIEFLAAIREGEAQADAGKVVPLEEVEGLFQKCFSKPS